MAVIRASRMLSVAAVLIQVAMIVMAAMVAEAQRCGSDNGGQHCSGKNCCSRFGYCGTSDDHCGSGCQPRYGKCGKGGSCFPGNALIKTRGGINKQISELAIGDEVAVVNYDGEVSYQDVYANGHLDAHALSEFITILLKNPKTNTSKTLQLTPDHFTITKSEKDAMIYKRAIDIHQGDMMMVVDDDLNVFQSVVTNVKKDHLMGLYNPFTLVGSIIVNDVVVSCHSEWFLDNTFDRLGISHLLPTTYQAILAPVRTLYKVIGKESYKSMYQNIDSRLNIAESGSKLGGYMKLLALSLSPTSHNKHVA